MANENETVAEIVREMRDRNAVRKVRLRQYGGVHCNCAIAPDDLPGEYADRIEASHEREVAKLKHWIKSAARWIKCHDIYHTSGDDLIKQAKEILDDDGEFLFKKGEQ